MTEKQDFMKFTFSKKFYHLPKGIYWDSLGLHLENTKVDMIPAGLEIPQDRNKNIIFVKKPLYIAPDFKGRILCENASGTFGTYMTEEEVEAAKARYMANREVVEKARYVEDEEGFLFLCSLPKNMKIILKSYQDYYLDLTRTDVSKPENFVGFKDVILYPKRQDLFSNGPRKVSHHKGRQMVHQKPRTIA